MNCDSRLHLQKESFAGRNNYHFRTQKYRKYSEKSAMAQPGTEVQPLLSLVDQEEEDDAPLFPPTPDEPSETVAPENVAAQTASSDAPAHPLASQASAQVPAASVEVVAPIAGGLPAMRFSRSQPAANATAQPFTGGEWTGDTPPTYEQTISASGVQPGPSSAPEAPALTALRTPLEVRQRRAKQRRCCFLIFAISVVLLTVILGTMLGLEHSSSPSYYDTNDFPKSTSAPSTTCPGKIYNGYCLYSIPGQSSTTPQASVCTPIQPDLNWTYTDYVALCELFTTQSATACSRVSTTTSGGRCSNHNAALAFTSSYRKDVWVNSHVFTYNPSVASTPSCAYTRYSQATIIFMCAWKAAPAAQTCSGWVYDNVCLKSTTSVATGSDDNVPAGCVAYTPDDTYWSSADYTAICNHFNGNDCSGSSWSPEGGRCSNYRALLSFGSSYSSPAVWVNSHAFTWNPATPYSQSCTLASERKSTLVYACAVVTDTAIPRTCSGFTYKGVCLRRVTSKVDTDIIPRDCSPYQPSVSWTRQDYYNICKHFSSTSSCTYVDTDKDGGRCSNHQAALSYEVGSYVDVWVNAKMFTWNPSTASNPTCVMSTGALVDIVYACKTQTAVASGCTGFLYRNNCLRSVTTSVNVDRIPPGCSPYQPSGIWTKNDYLAICQHFGGSSNCANVDTDYNGGRCSNFQALLSYENYGSPDVWVNKNSFVWSPTDTYPDCKLISSASTVVYACNNPAATTPPQGMCSGGIIYKGICLRSSQLTRNSDSVPSGCSYYSPPMVWSKSDYNAICNAFGGSSNCFNVDSDFDGGRCTNHYAILSYENNGYPDVWVNGNTFQWNPVSSTTSPSCYLQSGFPTTAIYACRQTTSPKPPTGCDGWMYNGVCLKAAHASTSTDHIPSGCTPYQPLLSWKQADFYAICSHFSGSVGCNNVDMDTNGGRCSNYKAVLAYESNSAPDVWVSNRTFFWYPAQPYYRQDCKLLPDPPGVLVYACEVTTPTTPIATTSPGCSKGWYYKGECLMWTSSYSSSDQVVSGCQIYQPTLTWNKQDYEAICSHVTGQNSCHTIDTDSDGGRCSNYQALLAFEGNSNPDVWVNAKSFAWSPTSSSAGNCRLIANPPGYIVYACKQPKPVTSPPPQPIITTYPGCDGWYYKGVCLQAVKSAYNRDSIPPACDVYSPMLSWTVQDYIAICQHFAGNQTFCKNVVSGNRGGLCSNYKATVSFESSFAPTIWTNNETFSWGPPKSNVYSSCNLLAYNPGTIVYSCRLQATSPTAVATQPTVSSGCSKGWYYKGECLMWTLSYLSSDRVVSGCQVYEPTLTWNQQDYEAICSHVTGKNSCHIIDTDSDGGRCSNYQALLAFEVYSNPDVWVNAKSFTWSPTSSSAGNCKLLADPPGYIVYACKQPKPTTPIPATTVPASIPGCKGWSYDGVCLMARSLSVADQLLKPGQDLTPPSSCTPYQPAVAWNFTQYEEICLHFKTSKTECGVYDFGYNGGRCTNHQAIVAFENNGYPDVWVNKNTFLWSPVKDPAQQDCALTFLPGTAVFACAVQGSSPTAPASTTPYIPKCKGWTYDGVCLMARSLSTIDETTVGNLIAPSSCTPYQPSVSWNFTEYRDICNHFKTPNTNCGTVDDDFNGGRCDNHQAVLAFENNAFPDVWVNEYTFVWSPSRNVTRPDCSLSFLPGTLVFACETD